jgi:hypothetical protein
MMIQGGYRQFDDTGQIQSDDMADTDNLMTQGGYRQFDDTGRIQFDDTGRIDNLMTNGGYNVDDTWQIQIMLMALNGYRQIS